MYNMPNPQQQVTVTHLGIDYVIACKNVFVRRKENGFDTATLVVEDTEAHVYSGKVSNDDAVIVEVKDASESSWPSLCVGIVRSVDPILGEEGNLLKIECDGAGYGLGVMLCGEEYGSDSANSSLDTIKEIIEDNTNGIIDLWVNKVLDTATNSGYSYTTQVETIAGTIGYYYSPFKPATKTINDVCDIVQAIKGTNAGPHWIVDTSNRFLLATVGNHGTPADRYWPTYWQYTQADSTLTEGVDFLKFRFNQLSKEANYVLYHGDVVKPLRLDEYTEDNSGSWGSDADCTVGDDAVDYKIGSKSIVVTMDNAAGATAYAYYPSTMDLGLNIDAMGGKYTVPYFHAWAMLDSTFHGDTDNTFKFAFFTSIGNFFYVPDQGIKAGSSETRNIPKADEWCEFTFPISSNWDLKPQELPPWMSLMAPNGAPDWTNINAIGVSVSFDAAAHGSEVWVDGMYIGGTILRAARQNAAYSSSDPCKIKLITDSVAKDDALKASDDSGLIGRLTYAEYLRCSSTPIVGSFTIEMAPNMLPGQLVHVHAKKKRDGTYTIDKDFRVLRLTHSIVANEYATIVEVSDDVKNANPRPVPNQYNVLLNAVRPETQDRQASSIKLRDIDITQPILEKSY